MQNLKGRFDITFRGTVLLAVSKSVLMAEENNGKDWKSTAIVYSLHITPLFAIGFTVVKKSQT